MSEKVFTELADALAADTIKAMDALGDERLYEEVAQVLGASSQTSEEAYMTSIRIRLAERRARAFLNDRVKAAMAGRAGDAPGDDGTG